MTVPLDRSGQVPGTVGLKVERKLAGFSPSRDAVLALAGGPGQSALGLGEFIAKAIAPALGARDLLVFDQRGTGESGPLSCPALSSQSEVEHAHSIGELVGRCAQQLGPARGDYTSQESVADIEALRQAGGYEKLVLYGTSYGTKVALEYAERYPQHVEALVLDSVVPTSGPEPFAVGTFQAIGGVLGELCADRACAGITSNPLADLARLTAQLRKHALSGSVYDGSGHRHAVRLSETSLLGILQAGDLNPALRALLPAAVVSALRHDPDPLLRLELLSEGLIPNVPGKRPVESSESIDETLFVDTSCEELPFPWQRSAPAPTRLAEALGSLRGMPSGDFYPFDATTALSASLVSVCASWPDASPPPPAPGSPAGGADADPLRRAGPAHADRERARRRRADPRLTAARRPVHRPLRPRQRLQRLRRAGRRRVLRRHARCSRAGRRRTSLAPRRSRRPSSPTSTRRRCFPASPGRR